MDDRQLRELHQDMALLGLEAPAMAAGLIQLTSELLRAGVLDQAAVDRIKDTIARDLVLCKPRNAWRSDFASSIRDRLDHLFETGCGGACASQQKSENAA